ncbi:uncharacterized protein LOC127839088 [Dreissena polymorpha]|uniref:Uncharacterized protein n=1 Tax=Dreissena polymorpha TaxID=45954 RepID=A0A9D4FJP0_DREPO|nr:uncharacterized protein LOC127839088 [Dreissena polymorpha]XP_052223241.1 uncharacterized protein LOC127839088 [Dreissena polymorpha]XP_052223243.1 uncharacterized protein LOC127839088 [Dreissena polymorpha]KAH3798448.1 hypothetical protein DPMN_152047 [Dreissena polymorpha]
MLKRCQFRKYYMIVFVLFDELLRRVEHEVTQSTCVIQHTGTPSIHYVESVSLEICNIMTRLGYGEEIRRWRIEKYCENDRHLNARPRIIKLQTAGSKAEGLTCLFESDRDFLYTLKGVICVETGINLNTIPDDISVFGIDDTGVYPGHCKLLLKRPAARLHNTIIKAALCKIGYGEFLLSSVLFIDECSRMLRLTIQHSLGPVESVLHERAGPALPQTVGGILKVDKVYSIRCQCPSILHRWAVRPRHWPQSVVVQKVVSLGAYVTPTGFKESKNKHIEWRICFNFGETELMNNLNDTQAKVYVLLKWILKDIIKPTNKEITSYVVKNIILWQAENIPQTEFNSRSLLHWLHDGLRELRSAIEKKLLKYYMIPERNLMEACGLEDALKRKWIKDITEMIEMGPNVILRLEKIRRAIIASPEPMLWFSKTRIELEMLYLEYFNRALKCKRENGEQDVPDFMLYAIRKRQEEIELEVGRRMRMEGCSINEIHKIIYRMLI